MNLSALEDDIVREMQYGKPYQLGQLPLLPHTFKPSTMNMIIALTILGVAGSVALFVLSRKKRKQM